VTISELDDSSASQPSTKAAELPKRLANGSIKKSMDRTLPQADVDAIDMALARFCFAQGQPFAAMTSPYLRESLGKLNSSYAGG
jgi:hypothetical protein